MKTFNVIFLLIFINTWGLSAFSGDVGEGGGVSSDIKKYLLAELRMTPHTLHYYFYLDELSLIGDAGEGGGPSLRSPKWWETFSKRVSDRMSEDKSVTLDMVAGEKFLFFRNEIPNIEFNKFELCAITKIITTNHGTLFPEDIYSFYIIKNDTVGVRQIPKSLGDLLTLETLDGTLIPLTDIIGVEITIKVR